MTEEVSQYAKAQGESARFTMILNDAIRDDRISWRAKGILAGCLSHANNFQFTKAWIIEHGTEGRDAVNNALNELRKYGYLEDRIKPVSNRRPINPEDQSLENQVGQVQAPAIGAARSSSRFAADPRHVPSELQNVAAMICEFFNEHKAGAKTKRAFEGLVKELMQIKLDKAGGVKAVQNQLSIAIKRSTMGEKKWSSITHENWQRYGQNGQSNSKFQSPQLPMISVAFAEDMV